MQQQIVRDRLLQCLL